MPSMSKISAYSLALLAIMLVWLATPLCYGAPQGTVCDANNDGIQTLTKDAIAKQLGWVQTNENRCGGYFLEAPFPYPENLLKQNLVEISSDQPFLFSRRGTSTFEGKVTITRYGQQISANRAYLYRDPTTGKLDSIDLIGHVELREPSSLVIAKKGHFNMKSHAQSLMDILYRTAIYPDFSFPITFPSNQELQTPRKILQLSAWGQAKSFAQEKPKVFEFTGASYSTCPPLTNTWRVEAGSLTLDKNLGRGTAKHARLLFKGLPVLYTPYLTFPLDHRRETGFLLPRFGSLHGVSYFQAPFYWNLAPNYDTTITPTYLTKRGFEFDDQFRYLTQNSNGQVRIGILPNDRLFKTFQQTSLKVYQNSTNTIDQANLRRLENASDTRKSFAWQHNIRFNEYWTGDVDYNYVSDDYYIRDLRNNLNIAAQNQLLQQAEVTYQGKYWNFLSRYQGYQTVHPIDEITFVNLYSRSPQLALDGKYLSERTGIEYTVSNEATHFDIRNTPGMDGKNPIGNRYNFQPGISYPINYPALYIIPRAQYVFTQYDIGHVYNGNSKTPDRALPIFDLNSGLYFDRDFNLFGKSYRQTLEPQIYYTYVPYRNQFQIPIFDTIVNQLTYDQLFTYNRFSGLDRIGDANQISAGIATRVIDQQSGHQKIYAGIGEIFYFQNRRVTLCADNTCPDNPSNADNKRSRSPISGTLTYNLNTIWSITANTIWDPVNTRLNNQTVALQYNPDINKIINLGYVYVRNGDALPIDPVDSPHRNLQQTDLSVEWPIMRDWSTVARWTQTWNRSHFQNLLYGLQYDSCCYAVRFVTGRTYTGITTVNTFQYNNQFYFQIALKGLGNVGGSDPSGYLSNSIAGYKDTFGRDF